MFGNICDFSITLNKDLENSKETDTNLNIFSRMLSCIYGVDTKPATLYENWLGIANGWFVVSSVVSRYDNTPPPAINELASSPSGGKWNKKV